jgi:hypothetical protein
MGLALDSGPAIAETAVGRVARETDTGPTGGKPVVDPPHFGHGMPVITPGHPAGSYLLYKLLVNPLNYGDQASRCETAHAVPLPSSACVPGASELESLQERFVALEPMPLNGSLAGEMADLRRLQSFIRGGAQTADCAER